MLRVLGLILIATAASSGAPPAQAQRNLAVSSPTRASETKLALLIGNSAYRDSPLKNPVNDATDMAETLRGLGWKVTLRTNATQRQMKEAIREFGAELEHGGIGLFYFAGHGLQYRGENFLVPVAANIERESHIEDETVSANFVLRQLDEAKNRTNIVILDACRNNPFARSFRSASRGLAQMDAAQGTLIAFATAPGSVAADGDGRNGVYTKHLLRQMRVPGVPVELMFKRVRDAVISETRDLQTPWESSSLRGADFYFIPVANTAGVPTAAASATEPAVPVAALSPAVASAASAFDGFVRAHVGVWSVKCEDPSAPRQEYRLQGDRLLGESRRGDITSLRFQIALSSVRALGGSGGMETYQYRLESENVSTNRRVATDAVLETDFRRRRNVSTTLEDGTVTVKGGRSVSTGAENLYFVKCR